MVFYKFSLIPKNVSYDEVDFTKLALSLDNKPYTVYSTLATGHSTLYFYILLGSLKLFGINSFALRLPSAMFGIVNVLLIFLVMNRIFKNNLTAFLTAFIFLTMRWYFNFARFSFEATFLLFLEMTSIYFLLTMINDKRLDMKSLILSAIFAGLAFHSYYPGRIFFILPAVWIFLSVPKKYGFIFMSIVGMIIAPLMLHNFLHPDVRVSQISFLSDPKIPIGFKINGVISNVMKTILMPFWKGDMNGRHNFPGKAALNPILIVFVLVGIWRACCKSAKYHVFFILYLIISIIPTVLTSPNDNPSMLRTITALPALVYGIGVGIQWLFQQIDKNKYRYVLGIIIGVFIFLSTTYELRTYFVFQSRVFKNAFEVTCELKDVVNTKIVPKRCRVGSYMF